MNNTLEEIKSRVKIQDVLEMYGEQPRRSLNKYLCIWHNDHNPSASITRDGNKMHCYACGMSGDIFDIVETKENCDLKTAMKIIDDNFHIGLMHELTEKEKKEFASNNKRREIQERKKIFWQRYEQKVLGQIVQEIRVYEECQNVIMRMKGKVNSGERCDLYFDSEKRLVWLNWLYETICGFSDKQEREWDFTLGSDKRTLLQKIRKNEITI